MTDAVTAAAADDATVLRPHAEQQFAQELAALASVDDRPRPASWRLSPWAVVTYLLGGVAGDTVISPKYVNEPTNWIRQDAEQMQMPPQGH